MLLGVLVMVGPSVPAIEGEPCADVGSTPLETCEAWVAVYNGPADYTDMTQALALNPSGTRVYVAGDRYASGFVDSSSAESDLLVAALDAATGETVWVAALDLSADEADLDRVRDLAVSADGNAVYAVGSGRGPLILWALDAATGEQAWLRTLSLDGPNTAVFGKFVEVSPDGKRVYAAADGRVADTSKHTQFLAFAFNASTGATVWSTELGSSECEAQDTAFGFSMAPNGTRLFLTGMTTRCATRFDLATYALDAEEGHVAWERVHAGPGEQEDSPRSLTVAPDGSRVYAAGHEGGTMLTLAYDAWTGQAAWSARSNKSPGADAAFDVEASPDGSRVFVTGITDADGFHPDFYTVAYDAATGSELWSSQYSGFLRTIEVSTVEYAFDLEVAPDGSRVVVAGTGTNPSDADYLTVAYDASTGEREWVARFHGPEPRSKDWGLFAELSPDGQTAYVAGIQNGSPSFSSEKADIATVAYSLPPPPGP